MPLGYSLDNIGPMARTARDCALMLQVLAGYDPQDPCSASCRYRIWPRALTAGSTNVRIGVPRAYFLEAPDLNAEVKQAVQSGAG